MFYVCDYNTTYQHKTIINKRLDIISQSIPTNWSTEKKSIKSIIDFGIIKNIAKTYFSIKTSLELSFYHSSIRININKVVKKMQPCVLCNKRTNGFLREQVKSILNIQISLKDHHDIIQAIEFIAFQCYYSITLEVMNVRSYRQISLLQTS